MEQNFAIKNFGDISDIKNEVLHSTVNKKVSAVRMTGFVTISCNVRTYVRKLQRSNLFYRIMV